MTTNPYNFTHNSMKKGVAIANPDITDESIESLKWDIENIPPQIAPFLIESGNLDSAGNGELLSGVGGTTLSFKTADGVGANFKPTALNYANKTQETLTSLASITGLTVDGTYTILKEKGQNPVAVPTPTYGKDLFVDFSQGNANDNYGLHTPTVIGSPTFTNGKLNQVGNSGVQYPFFTVGSGAWCSQGKFKSTNATTLQFLLTCGGNSSIISLGKTTANKLELYLSSNGSTSDIANGVLGTKNDWSTSADYYFRLRYLTASEITRLGLTGLPRYEVQWSTDGSIWTTDITVVSSTPVYSSFNTYPLLFGLRCFTNLYPLIGTMDDIQVTIGQSVCQIKNQVTQGKTPTFYRRNGDYYCNTATTLKTTKVIDGDDVETQWVYLSPLNGVTVSGGVITAVSTQPYNQNGYDVNTQTEGALTKCWVSGEYTQVLSTQTIATHNLKLTPSELKNAKLEVLLKCTVAEHGYQVGDLVEFNTYYTAAQWGVPTCGLRNNTAFVSTSGNYNVIHNTSGAVAATNQNWKYVFRIWY